MKVRKPYRLVARYKDQVLETAEFRAMPEQMEVFCNVLNMFVMPRGLQVEIEDDDREDVKS